MIRAQCIKGASSCIMPHLTSMHHALLYIYASSHHRGAQTSLVICYSRYIIVIRAGSFARPSKRAGKPAVTHSRTAKKHLQADHNNTRSIATAPDDQQYMLIRTRPANPSMHTLPNKPLQHFYDIDFYNTHIYANSHNKTSSS